MYSVSLRSYDGNMLAIKIFRLWRKQTQWQLGQAAQITNYKISQFECGKLEPTPDELRRLAEALQTTSETLRKEVSEEALVASGAT